MVSSLAGRDKEHLFFVVKVDGDFVYLIDGDIRKVEKPKKKKLKHISATDFSNENIKLRILNHNKITNQDVKRALKNFQVAK